MGVEDSGGATVIYRSGASATDPDSRYPGFEPGRTIIEAGTVVKEGAAPIERDLVFDRDVGVELRDGTKIYTDVYRPADVPGPLPAIIAWSPYGKREGFILWRPATGRARRCRDFNTTEVTYMTKSIIEETTNAFYQLTWSEVQIPMRDGVFLAANLYRPEGEGRFPVLVTMSPYGKDLHFTEFAPANPTIVEDYSRSQDKGPLVSWEAPNPDFWVPQGYAVLRIDERGIGRSPGKLDILSESFKQDFYDAIEWAGTQEWSNGRVGLTGVSYLAMSQWAVASEQSPHLTCMIPWEGTVDYYAEFCYPGGIMANGFVSFWYKYGVLAHQHNPDGAYSEEELEANQVDFMDFVQSNPLRTETWTRRFGDLDKIEVPFLSASNWFSAGIHTRGNYLAFQKAPVKHKWLEVHLGSHVGEYYSVEGRALQKKFLDYWLKDIDTGLMHEPKVKLAIPRGGDDFTWRYENEYPLARTRWTPFYLDATGKTLGPDLPQTAAEVGYEGDKDRESADWAHPYYTEPFSKDEASPKRVLFETAPFEEETEILGPIKLRLWASSSLDDMDVFVSLRNIGPNGQEVVNAGSNIGNFPISQGWLRASLRKLDAEQSTEWKPIYAYDAVQKLTPNRAYPLEIELWDSAMVVWAADKNEQLSLSEETSTGFFVFPLDANQH